MTGIPAEGLSPLIDDAMRTLTAEDARLRATLPAPPAGFAWVPQLEASDHDFMFAHRLRLVLVYRLHPIP